MLTYKTNFLKNNYFPKQKKNEKSRTVLQFYKSIQYLAWEEITRFSNMILHSVYYDMWFRLKC